MNFLIRIKTVDKEPVVDGVIAHGTIKVDDLGIIADEAKLKTLLYAKAKQLLDKFVEIEIKQLPSK